MTEPIEGQEKDGKIELSPEVQKFFDKQIGKARVKARELAKVEFEQAAKDATADAEREQLAAAAEWKKLSEMHEGRVTELEPFEAEAKAYRELVKGMLKDKVKALGEVAKKFVAKLPDSLSDLEKLDLLKAVEDQFETDTPRVGTPARKKKQTAGKSERPEGHRKLHL